MSDPLVSVLMPVFNAEAYLRAAIESILSQTYRAFEFLIVDDHSTDSSRRIAEEYQLGDPRVQVMSNDYGKGVSGALNTGLARATGAYVARMDADDVSLPERFSRQVAYMDAHPDVGVCGTWVRLIGDHEGEEWRLAEDWATIRCTMLFYGAVAHPTVMLRLSVFLEHGWTYDPTYSAEDYELWTRIAVVTPIVNIPEVLLLYRTHPVSATRIRGAQLSTDSDRVRLRELQRFGVSPTVAEWETHKKISDWRLESSHAFARQSNAWLDRLQAVNDKARYYPTEAFAAFLTRKRKDIEDAATANPVGPRADGDLASRCFDRIKAPLKHLVPKVLADRLVASMRVESAVESLQAILAPRLRTQQNLRRPFSIGMAVLAHERPDYLELCLDSLFKTNLHDYDITFLISDDGSQDPRVREIIDLPRDPRYKIVRAFTPKGPNNAGAAINKAVRRLFELGDFDVIGWCDPDALFHPEWLDRTMKICLWAKQRHKFHVLGPFSSFNSSDYIYHRVLGSFWSPHGRYLVKRQMGMVNCFYFAEDFRKLGFFTESPDDETLMTVYLEKFRVRNFCTETSYVEHLGQESILNQWRPTPVRRLPHGMRLAPEGWGYDMEQLSPYAFYRYLKKNATFGANITPSTWPLDVLIPVIRKDLPTLPLAIVGLRKNLRHPLGKIILVSPPDAAIQEFCRHNGCEWRDENSVLPIQEADIRYDVNGRNRAGWIFKQILQLYADHISDAEHILLFDADTILLQPQKFEHEGRNLMLVSDEYHWPYFVTYRKLFGYLPHARFSLIAHHLLVNRRRLTELRAELEQRHQRPWYQAIVDNLDPRERSSFAEYESYGHWMLHNHRDEVDLEYWFNIAIPRRKLWLQAWDLHRCNQRYRAASYHHYHA